MTVRIDFGKQVLTADDKQWLVVEPKVNKQTGETYDRPVAFCTQLGAALSRIAERKLRQSDATSVAELRAELDRFHSECAQLIDPARRVR